MLGVAIATVSADSNGFNPEPTETLPHRHSVRDRGRRRRASAPPPCPIPVRTKTAFARRSAGAAALLSHTQGQTRSDEASAKFHQPGLGGLRGGHYPARGVVLAACAVAPHHTTLSVRLEDNLSSASRLEPTSPYRGRDVCSCGFRADAAVL